MISENTQFIWNDDKANALPSTLTSFPNPKRTADPDVGRFQGFPKTRVSGLQIRDARPAASGYESDDARFCKSESHAATAR
jgi:hypothetical protein